MMPLVLRPVPVLPNSWLPRFIKKLTVIGMMGHTQGVRTAIKPPINPNKKIVHREGMEESDVEDGTGADGRGELAILVSLVVLVVLVVLVSLVRLVAVSSSVAFPGADIPPS